MAKRIMSRTTRRKFPPGSAQTASDLLENKLEQLCTFLWCCYGTGDGWFEEAGPERRETILWMVSDLAWEARELFQEVGVSGSAVGVQGAKSSRTWRALLAL